MQAPSRGFADGRGHRGRLQPVEGGLQALVVVEGRAAPDEAQNLVRRGAYPARRAQARVARLHDLRGGPYQHVGIPYRCDAVLLRAFHANGDVPLRKSIGAVRLTWQARRTERPSSPGNRVAPCRSSARNRSSCSRCGKACPGGLDMAKATRRRSAAITVVARVALGVFGIGRGLVAALVGPGIEVGHRVHDAAAELGNPPPITRCFSRRTAAGSRRLRRLSGSVEAARSQ